MVVQLDPATGNYLTQFNLGTRINLPPISSVRPSTSTTTRRAWTPIAREWRAAWALLSPQHADSDRRVGGRPNVGKSTLFNRLVGKRVALVDDRPGVTRDRRGRRQAARTRVPRDRHRGFRGRRGAHASRTDAEQTEAAVRDADAALFLIDGREGLTPLDEEIARWSSSGDDAGRRRCEQS